MSYDSSGTVVNGNVPAAVDAFHLMTSLESMRDNAMYNDLSYQNGKAITADDLKSYVKQYQDLGVPLNGMDVIAKAETVLEGFDPNQIVGQADPNQIVGDSNKASAA